jgi:uncharacterized membrane protein
VTSREVAADEPASKSKLREQSIWTIIGALTYANKVHNPDSFLYRTAWRAIPGSSSTTSHTASTKQVKILEQKRQYKQALDSVEKGHAQYPQKGRTAATLAYLLAASPQYDLRAGARALELAQLIYKATGSLEHGAIVAMALAELGRCTEAAEWRRRLIATAERERKTDLVTKLNADLKLYERGQPCRPAGDPAGQAHPN